MCIFESQDKVDTQKENLIEQVEAKMKQSIRKDELFTIEWKVF